MQGSEGFERLEPVSAADASSRKASQRAWEVLGPSLEARRPARTLRLPGGALVFLVCFGSSVRPTAAAPLPVANPSFEQPATGPGTFITSGTSAPAGWSIFGTLSDAPPVRHVGVLNPATTTLYVEAVPDGSNVGVVFLQGGALAAGLQQTLTDTLQSSTQYTLTVEVGNIGNDPNFPHNQFDFSGFPGYRIELLAGTTVLASDDDQLLPPERGFLTSTVSFVAGAGHPNAGQSLGIRLINLNGPGIEVNFDDVRLDAASSTATPTQTPSPTPSLTSTPSPSPTPPSTQTPLPTSTGTPGQAATATQTPLPTSTRTPGQTATATQPPLPTSTRTPSQTATPTVTPSGTAVPSSTPTPSLLLPTSTETPVPATTETATASQTPSTPAETASPTPTETASPTPTAPLPLDAPGWTGFPWCVLLLLGLWRLLPCSSRHLRCSIWSL